MPRQLFKIRGQLVLAAIVLAVAWPVHMIDSFVLRPFGRGVARQEFPSHHSVQRVFTALLLTADDNNNDNNLPALSNEEIARYSRHLVLSDVGIAGQQRLKHSSVLCIGAGGLGSPVLMYLTAAGVGRLGIVDADVVDTSNLQRQIIHGEATVGSPKVMSAKQRLRDINPHVQVKVFQQEFTSTTALDILKNGFDATHPWTVVVDGSDNFPTKYLINDACALTRIPWVYAAILGFEGQLSVFDADIDYRDLLPTPPPPGDVPSCAEGGVLGVLPGTLGCLQATETLKVCLGRNRQTELCHGRVLIFDAIHMKFSQVGLERAPNRAPITGLLDYHGFCAGPSSSSSTTATRTTSLTDEASNELTQLVTSSSSSRAGGRTLDEAILEHDTAATPTTTLAPNTFHAITPHDALAKLQKGWSPWVLDVRLETEHAICHLPFVDIVVPHRQVRASHVPEIGDVLVYCKAGTRGRKACDALIQQGVPAGRLYNLQGGILAWQADIDPSMPRY